MPITNEAFAKKMMKALRGAGFGGEMRYDADRFAIVSKERGEFFLHSAHQFYTQASFWRRGGVIKYYARTMFSGPAHDIPKTFDEARGNLVPIVRNTAYLDVARLIAMTSPNPKGDGKHKGPHFEPIAGTLCVGLAYDTPNTLAMFAAEQLEKWNVTFEEAMKAARYNLSVRSRDEFKRIAPGLFMAPWQDANAAARLILTEVLARLPVKGDVVAMAPGRDYLLVAGSDDADALGAMVVAAEKAIADPKPNTPEMYRLDGTKWLPFTLPLAHPLRAKHDELVKVFVASDYEQQKKFLDEIHERDGTDVFVASYTPLRRPTGEVYSCCSWAPCVSLLPRTDEIAIFDADAQLDKGAKPVMVAWSDAVEVVGHRIKRDERFQMERYLVEESPTADEMGELRQRAKAP